MSGIRSEVTLLVSIVMQSEPAYSEAIRILESGASFLSSAKNPSSQMAFGRLELNLATVHANMSNFEAAAEHLKLILNSRSPPLLVKGAALEALAALCVQLHQDQEGMDYATAFAELWGDEYVHAVTSESLQDVKSEAIALRILAEMVNPSESLHAEVLSSADVQNISGAAVLAFAEFHHVVGNFPVAKNLYKKAITSSKQDLESSVISLSAIAMTPEAVHIGAITGLGQLLISVGDFEEAEVQLTEALKDIEKIKGEKHPHVGVILACIGHLYQQRGIARGSNEIFLVEGMYKSALDLMKASPLESDNKGRRMTDIVALTRARLGTALTAMPSRYNEVQKLKDWVDTVWNFSRPLPELVQLKQLLAGKKQEEVLKDNRGIGSFIDIRLERVFFK
ncbi:hypothetical protein KP509_13G012800 [Ceratopteris richardii]|uniref:Uncharacterized protein n=1 Tax=Ceratopteris richardii TaxID=49495 RepID=A0A8T2TFF5_CERRI|nr:hypothetical protein KP509_13G012800 [Ceratopteris richardii]